MFIRKLTIKPIWQKKEGGIIVRYLKENPKGVSEMCKVMEDMQNEALKEGIKEGAIISARRMIAIGKYTLDEIANISGLSLDEIKKLQADKNM